MSQGEHQCNGDGPDRKLLHKERHPPVAALPLRPWGLPRAMAPPMRSRWWRYSRSKCVPTLYRSQVAIQKRRLTDCALLGATVAGHLLQEAGQDTTARRAAAAA